MAVMMIAVLMGSPATGGEIHDACRDGDLEAVRVFLDAKPKLVKSRDGGGMTPLHVAAGNDRLEIVDLLLAGGAGVNVKAGSARTPLHLASVGAGPEVVELLLANGARINARGGKNRFTPLLFAVAGNSPAVVRLLLDGGADVNVRSGKKGLTALHLAAFRGNPEIVGLLLARGAGINLRDKNERTPLDWAIEGGNRGVARYLLDRGGR